MRCGPLRIVVPKPNLEIPVVSFPFFLNSALVLLKLFVISRLCLLFEFYLFIWLLSYCFPYLPWQSVTVICLFIVWVTTYIITGCPRTSG